MDPVQKALWYVESHSRESISLEEIASACKVSAFHLTRAFAASAGRSLMRYVRARRLCEAARRLAGGAENILEVALDAGYGSHEAFTRAFRDQFGLTPEHVRAQGHLNNVQLVEAIAMDMTSLPELAPPRFETREPMVLAGLVERYNCEAATGIPDQWQRFGPQIGFMPRQVGKAAYGASYNMDRESNFDYMCAVEVASAAHLPKGLTALSVPRQKYAIFAHGGHIASIRGVMAAIWSKWVPESSVQVAEGPTIERYGPEFNPRTGMGGFEIWVPIRE
jgi:AraC family transcriptional regulator